MQKKHFPVLFLEAIEALRIQPDHWYIDATFGRGGHTQKILNLKGNVIAFDVDHEAIDYAQKEFANDIEAGRLIILRNNFSNITTAINDLQNKIPSTKNHINISGILFDFGTSVDQLTSETRGFSFSNTDQTLDMRMDDRLGVKASDLLKVMDEKQLSQVFSTYGGEPEAKKIAKAITKVRREDPSQLETVGSVIDIIVQAKKIKRGHLHPATKVFQALRIVVNDELKSIEDALPQALIALKPGGRIATISFHEGEDRIAKHLFAKWEDEKKGERITKKPIVPSAKEIEKNKPSRSAKLRIFEKN